MENLRVLNAMLIIALIPNFGTCSKRPDDDVGFNVLRCRDNILGTNVCPMRTSASIWNL